MTFHVHGYSERGMLWTLLKELAHHPDANELLVKLLNRITFRSSQSDFGKLNSSTLMIEQSFSGFGDADVLLLLDHGASNRCIFIEAKVCCGKQSWNISGELKKFKDSNNRQNKAFSNLFCQLYAKQRLVETLKRGEIPNEGVDFLKGFRRRKIGNNPVVGRAVSMLKPYVQHAIYVALISNDAGFHDSVREFETLSGDTCEMWAVLSWAQVECFCREHKLDLTLKAFEHNHSQIY